MAYDKEALPIRWYLMAFREGGGLVDGPWAYATEETANEAMARYTLRASAEGCTATLLSADSLDDLIEEHADLFAEREGKMPMRGPRALTRVDPGPGCSLRSDWLPARP